MYDMIVDGIFFKQFESFEKASQQMIAFALVCGDENSPLEIKIRNVEDNSIMCRVLCMGCAEPVAA